MIPRGRAGADRASQLAAMAPTASWPSAPMFHRPIEKASATARPVRTSGAAMIKVCSTAKAEPNAPTAISRYARAASRPVASRKTAPIAKAAATAPARISTASTHSPPPKRAARAAGPGASPTAIRPRRLP